jgi:peptidoglycan/xylan/chitin deacetylase (PgdA/CDA1 family)
VEPGDIILLHDVFPTSVEAALEAIDVLTKQGYTFVTADELLID